MLPVSDALRLECLKFYEEEKRWEMFQCVSNVQLFLKTVNKTVSLLCIRKWLRILGQIAPIRTCHGKYIYWINKWQINVSFFL